MRVLICDDMFPAMIDSVSSLLPNDDVIHCRQPQVPAKVAEADVIIPAMCRITREIIEAAPKLRLIQQFGVGLEGVDIEAASSRGVPVANVPGIEAPVHAECTAEGGVFLMMACSRMFKACLKTLAAGEWGRPRGQALIGRTALIIGLGAVGRALASRLVALGVRILAADPALPHDVAAGIGIDRLAGPEKLNELLPEADFVVSCATLTPQTKGLLNTDVFSRMKETSYLINISRGPIVNEPDLLEALDKGLIAGAGLDVLNQEPPDPNHPLAHHDKVIVTPHTAGVTEQSFKALGMAVAENIERLKRGQPLKNVTKF